MQSQLKPHPATSAFLLLGGAFIVAMIGYMMFVVPDRSAAKVEANGDLIRASMWTLLLVGALMWLFGGIIFGKSCGLDWFVSLFLHFVPLLGLIAMFFIGKKRVPYGAWVLPKSGSYLKATKRTHRSMKPLY
jgi:hypothetical protein